MNPLTRILIVIAAFCIAERHGFAQGKNQLDSLWGAFNNSRASDSLRIDAIHTITIKLSRMDPDSGLNAGKYYHAFAASNADREKYFSGAFNATGTCYLNLGMLDSSLAHFNKSLYYRIKFKEKKGEAAALNNIGIIYYKKGDYYRCLDYYHRSLTLKDSLQDKSGVASSYSNIGMIYEQEGNLVKALECYRKSLHLRDSMNDTRGLADSYIKLGGYHMAKQRYDSSLYYVRKGIKYAYLAGDVRSAITGTTNLGNIFEKTGLPDSALFYFNKTLEMHREFQNDEGISNVQAEIGWFFLEQRDFRSARLYCDSAYALSSLNGYAQIQWESCYCLAQAYEELNQPEQALHYLKLSMELSDSLSSAEKSKMLHNKGLQYEFEKELLADSLRIQKEKELSDAEHQQDLQKQSLYTIAGVAGFVVMLVIAFVLYRGYRLKRTTNIELEKKNLLIEEKQKSILDSITYAKRLQEAILPPVEFINRHLPSNFIFYRPKDIVAGDFYWMEQIDDVKFIAAADCTGHGVPGALVSVVCSNALNRSLLEFGIKDPGKILDRTRELVLETFSRSDKNVYDGMDISLAAVSDHEIRWAGANNPLWIVEDGVVHEYKPDKQAIGKETNPKPFTTVTIPIRKKSRIFLFTDGYADQFGGPHGKKFKYKQLEQLLLSTSTLRIEEQRIRIEKAFDDWKGSMEQIDDVCVIGIEVS